MIVVRRGFTLLELLVVCLILGILAAVVVANFTGDDQGDEVRSEANRLRQIVELARHETIAKNEIWGMFIDGESYYFARLNLVNSTWNDINERPYRVFELPYGVRLKAIDPANEDQKKRANVDQVTPKLLFYPNGEISPVQFDVTSDDGRFLERLQSDGIQRLQFVESD